MDIIKDLLPVLFIIVAVIIVALVAALVVVIFGGINALHKNGHHDVKGTLFESQLDPSPGLDRNNCPYCGEKLERDAKFSDPKSDRRGLLYCRRCNVHFKLYTTGGLSTLVEAWGTPPQEGDNHD